MLYIRIYLVFIPFSCLIMRILLNGLTQRPGGGMVVLQGLVSGIASASETDELVVIAYDDDVYACLKDLGLSNVQVIQANKINALFDKLVVPYRVRATALKYKCDILVTLNFHVPLLPIPQVVYHVDLERFEHHSLLPLSLHNMLEKLRDRSAKRALIKADANVFESNFVHKTAEKHCKVTIQNPSVIYIGIDGTTVQNENAITPVIDNGLIVVVTNPLIYKNNEAVVPIVAALASREPNVNWRIRLFGGKGIAVWCNLIDLAEKAGIRDRFEFMGYRTRTELNASLDVAVCQLNTSRLESFCMVALEAMARGCPVIVSQDAAMPESVGDAGVILDPDNTLAIVDKISQLNSDKESHAELKNKAIMWASKHTWDRSGNAFYKLCYELRTS